MRRVLHSPEAELSVLGAVFASPDALAKLEGLLEPDDFYNVRNRTMYETMLELHRLDLPLDYVMLRNQLELEGNLERVGGVAAISQLFELGVTNAEYHAGVVKEMSQRRRLIAIAEELQELAYSDRQLQEVTETSERIVFSWSNSHANRNKGPNRVNRAEVEDTFASYLSRQKGTTTGLHDLDELTMGMTPGSLVVSAGATSMGKTAFALQIAAHVAENLGAVAFYSLEMAKHELIWRMSCSLASVDGMKARRRGKFEENAKANIEWVQGLLADMPLFIDDRAVLTPAEVRSSARQLASRQGGLKLIVIDYLQIMEVGGDTDNRVVALGNATRQLKGLARELGCPVLLLSQLSRKPMERADKRPLLSDLRESGAIEQDADTVLFVYRPKYYESKDNGMMQRGGSNQPEEAEVLVSKQRNGPVGTIKVLFRPEFARFDNKDWRSGL